ncbi:MAG TPA: hypothetical protein VGC23_03450 [Vicinamibacterales bacterium]
MRAIPMPTGRIESAPPDSKSVIDNSTASNLPQDPKLSPNAPKDRPVDARGTKEIDEYRAALAPYVAKGRQTYPEAKHHGADGDRQSHRHRVHGGRFPPAQRRNPR